MIPRGLFAVLVVLIPFGELQAQLPRSLVVEARGGYALPMGGGDAQATVDPRAGPAFTLGGRLGFTRTLGLYAAYHQMRLRCGGCAARDLDETMVLAGAEGGAHIHAGRYFGHDAWLRGGALVQTIAFSAGSQRMTSKRAIGFTVAGGMEVPVADRIALLPGIRYLRLPSEFSFSEVPDQKLDIASLAVDLGIAFRVR